ncbi:MAG: hypothetical protein WCK54_11545 [Desulfuromonadales bacterium]
MKTKSLCMCALALALTTATLTGCNGGGGTPPAPSVGKQTVELYTVSGVLKETDGYAMPGTITLTAKNAAGPVKLFLDQTGGTEVPVTGIVVDATGALSFYVDKNAALPVTIDAKGVASIPNHVDSGVKFSVTKAGTTTFEINIIDMDVPALGVNTVAPALVAETGLADADDVLLATINTTDLISSTKVTIPAGTKFIGSDNLPLKKGVKALLTTFSTSSSNTGIFNPDVFTYNPEADGNTVSPKLFSVAGSLTQLTNESDLENFPGGLGNNNSPDGGYFVTAGFVSVDVVDVVTGKLAKSITTASGPGNFTIRMNIAPGTLDPNTGIALQAGDTVPVYTYDMNTLTWTLDTAVAGTVMKDPGTGQLYVDHATNHFSLWNLGWLVKNTKTVTNSCSATMTMVNDAITLPLNLSATFSTPGTTFLLTGLKPAKDTTINLKNVPNQNIDIVMTDSLNNVIWTMKAVNLCSAANQNTPIKVNYKAPTAKTPVPVTVHVTEFCKQDKTIRQSVPSTPTTVTTSKNNTPGANPPVAFTPVASGTTDINGNVLFNLLPGKYNFNALDRRTKIYVNPTVPNPCAIAVGTPVTINVEIQVVCKPAPTGSAGGAWIF